MKNWSRYLLIIIALISGTIAAIFLTQGPAESPPEHPTFIHQKIPQQSPDEPQNQTNDNTSTTSALSLNLTTVAQQDWQYLDKPYDRNDPRRGVPEWQNDPRFTHDAFTFVRVQYSEGDYGDYGGYGNRRGWGRGGRWRTDYPDSDLNFSFRLQQLTSLKVNPDPIFLQLTDDRLFDYPFIYMIEPQALYLSGPEVKALRRYFDNGGFMMVDDFWGEYEFQGFYNEIKKVYPDRDAIPLTLEHPIFHCVYDLKEMPQVPSMHSWQRWGVSYEREDAQQVDYRAFYDDKGRMTMIICHNTDLGDGWEREGEDKEYFRLFSERLAYPMGINIVVYAMTH